MKNRQQNTTSYPMCFLMVSSTDHITPVTGLTPTVTISKNGAAFGSPSGAVSEIGSGWYALAGNATDRNTLGDLLIHATGTGADPVDDRYSIVAYDPYDSVRMGLTALPNAAADAAGGLPISDAGGLDLDTRLNHLDAAISSRSSHSAADVWAVGTRTLSSFGTLVADVATAVWGAVARTITGGTVDTCTTNTDMRGTDSALLAANYTAPDNSGITDIKAKTDQLTFTTPNSVDATATVSTAGIATEAKQDEIIADIAGVITHGDANWLTPSGIGGTIAITFNVKDDSGNNILDAVVEVWDTAGTALKERKETNSSGNAVFNCKAEAYTIKITKAGYSFDNASYTVTVPATVNYVMTAFVIPLPSDPDLCRVYAYLFEEDGDVYGVTDSALEIITQPDSLSGEIYSAGAATYIPATGFFYWDIVKGAVCKITIEKFGIYNKTITVPDEDTAKIKTLVGI